MEKLKELFISSFGKEAESVTPLSAAGSNRRYFRIQEGSFSCVGVVGTDAAENRAFVEEARHFCTAGLPVPEVLAVSEDWSCYIQTDLGDTLLYEMVSQAHKAGEFSAELQELLCRTMKLLPKLQFEGARGLDFSICYPEPEFSGRMVMFDLNYFKYCFLKPSGLEFNEAYLQDDFERMTEHLMKASDLYDSNGLQYKGSTFMYRDFQSRNVMVCDGHPYFIDFQGGRRGPVHYDVASFIWHARSAYDGILREKMLDAYFEGLSQYVDVDRNLFEQNLRKFVLFRLLQVLGAYGYRGWMEHKAKFVTSIPAAISELCILLSDNMNWATEYPYLYNVLAELVKLPRFKEDRNADGKLTVKVYSFSFLKGVPYDPSGNGGGYVFDCRGIHNPGRYEPYKKLTGRDEPVIKFLEDDGEVFGFLEHVQGVVDPHVETYVRRGFDSLMVSFGCTGGQHRSVYCAEHLARYLAERYPEIHVRLIHREQGIDEIIR